MSLKVQQYEVDALTGTIRKVFGILNEDIYQSPQEIVSLLGESGVSLSIPAVEKICRDLHERGFADRLDGKRMGFRRAKVVAKERAETVRIVPASPAPSIRDRFLAVYTEMDEYVSKLEREIERLRTTQCDPDEIAELRVKAQQLEMMKEVLGSK